MTAGVCSRTCASDGLRSSSGPMSALRILRLRLALGFAAGLRRSPPVSASRPAPHILAFRRSGAPRAGYGALELRRAVAGCDHAIQTGSAIRPSCSEDILASGRYRCGGAPRDRCRGSPMRLRGNGRVPFEPRHIEIDNGARIGTIDQPAILPRSSVSLPARGRTCSEQDRAARRGWRERRDHRGQLVQRRRAAIRPPVCRWR